MRYQEEKWEDLLERSLETGSDPIWSRRDNGGSNIFVGGTSNSMTGSWDKETEKKVLSPEDSALRLQMMGWRVGEDGRLWEETKGAVRLLTPVQPSHDGEPVFQSIDETKLPYIEHLRFLYDSFFSKYQREVWVWFAQNRVAPFDFRWFVPLQEGTMGSVSNKDADSLAASFIKDYRFVGTIHTHPGNSCQPSHTDLTTWSKPEFSGLHFILARDRTYTLNAAVRGKTWTFQEARLPEGSQEVVLEVQDGKTLEEALTEPQTYRYVSSCQPSGKFGYHSGDVGETPAYLFDIGEVRTRIAKRLEQQLQKPDDAELRLLEGLLDTNELDVNEKIEELSDQVTEEGGLWYELQQDEDGVEFLVTVLDGRVLIGPLDDMIEIGEPVLLEQVRLLKVRRDGTCVVR